MRRGAFPDRHMLRTEGKVKPGEFEQPRGAKYQYCHFASPEEKWHELVHCWIASIDGSLGGGLKRNDHSLDQPKSEVSDLGPGGLIQPHRSKSIVNVVPMHLKLPHRIEAMLNLSFIALMVMSLMEREIRRNMESEYHLHPLGSGRDQSVFFR